MEEHEIYPDKDNLQAIRYLEARIAKSGLSPSEMKALLAEYEQAQSAMRERRSLQFSSVVRRIQACREEIDGDGDIKVGIILWQFAKHVVEESRLIGIKPRDTSESIVDQLPDMSE